MINQRLRQLVRKRAKNRCEYCHLAQSDSTLPHEVDHIRAIKHHGATSMHNTCLACAYCNLAKGSNVAGYDPETDELVHLFNPRMDRWEKHFSWKGAVLVGITAIGRATIDVLRINQSSRIVHRQWLLDQIKF